MKFLVGEFMHETNTFSSVPATLERFEEQGICRGAAIPERFAGSRTSLGGFIDVAARAGAELVYTVAAHATRTGAVGAQHRALRYVEARVARSAALNAATKAGRKARELQEPDPVHEGCGVGAIKLHLPQHAQQQVERPVVAEYYQRCFGEELSESASRIVAP